MDSSLVLKIMISITLSIGLLCAIVPFISRGKRKLVGMMTASIFYLISIILLGIFYIQNGIVSCVFLELGAFNLKFHVEFLSLIFLGNLAFLWCVTVCYTYYYLKQKRSGEKDYCHTLSFMALCVAAASLMAMAANMMTMFVFYELLTLFTIPLVYQTKNHDQNSISDSQGSFSDLSKYIRPLLYPALLLWLPAILYIGYVQGSADFTGVPQLNLPASAGITLLLMCIFGISKAASVPCHSWLPAAMAATHPVSAMLHSVAVVNAGLLCIFKLILYILGFEYLNKITGGFNWLVIIPAVTIIYSGVRALMCDDIKQLLAYSTISQLATCLVGILLLSKAGLAASVMHMLSHSAAKITLFFAAGSVYLTAGKSKISELEGVYYRMPYTTVIFCIAALSLTGAPVLAGYISKAYLHEASHDHNIASFALTSSTVLTCLYMLKVMRKFFVKVADAKKLKERIGLLIPVSICTSMIMAFPIIAYVTEKLLGFL